MKHFLRIAALLALFAFPSLAEAAARFAVCTTTCTWDGSSTAMWSASTGGATGASVPGSGDTVTLDANTCVGGTTCTITMAAATNPTITSITLGACTASTTGCVLAFGSNNVTFSASAANNAFSLTGTGTRNVSGTGTFTFTNGSIYDLTTNTNGTFAFSSATLVFNGASSTGNNAPSFLPGGQAYGTVTVNSRSTSTSGQAMNLNAMTGTTITTLNINGPVQVGMSGNFTATNLNISGSGLTGMAGVVASATAGTQITITCTAAAITYAVFRNIKPTCAANATNSIDLGGNDFTTGGGSITAPSAGGGRIIGG